MSRWRLEPVVTRGKGAARRVIGGVVSTASTAYYGRWYYSNRWHPHHALLEDALAETVAYIKEQMADAIIRRNDLEVIDLALRRAPADGLVLEFGVRGGRSVDHIARRRPGTTVHGFDSFEGLPAPWTGYTMDAGAFRGRGVPHVERNVELHVGWFDDTLPPFVAAHAEPVAFVHVDSDIYESARTVLYGLAPRFVPGSVIVFNEYFNYPNWRAHEFRAFQEFCLDHDVRYEYLCWGMYEVAVKIVSIGEGSIEPAGGQPA
jgi:hypothetical protein